MYCDFWTKWSKIEQQTGLLLATLRYFLRITPMPSKIKLTLRFTTKGACKKKMIYQIEKLFIKVLHLVQQYVVVPAAWPKYGEFSKGFCSRVRTICALRLRSSNNLGKKATEVAMTDGRTSMQSQPVQQYSICRTQLTNLKIHMFSHATHFK